MAARPRMRAAVRAAVMPRGNTGPVREAVLLLANDIRVPLFVGAAAS